jgi:hypothetical protein
MRAIPLIAAALLLSGCATTAPQHGVPAEATTARGLALGAAREKSIRLHIGMNSSAARTLLGEPDYAASTTYGSQTAKPWHAREWVYSWKHGFYSQRLTLAFEEDSGLLNSWDWLLD